MNYSTSAHAKFHARYHIVWITKYLYKVLTKEMRLRIREIARQICEQLGVQIIKGVLSNNHGFCHICENSTKNGNFPYMKMAQNIPFSFSFCG